MSDRQLAGDPEGLAGPDGALNRGAKFPIPPTHERVRRRPIDRPSRAPRSSGQHTTNSESPGRCQTMNVGKDDPRPAAIDARAERDDSYDTLLTRWSAYRAPRTKRRNRENRDQRFGAMPEMEKALWNRSAGRGPKPPQAASTKSRGGERCGKRQAISLSGESRGDERKRTNRRRAERPSMTSKPGGVCVPGEVRGVPVDCLDGVRRIGGVTSVQAQAWNVGTRLSIPSDQGSARARTSSGGNREGLSSEAGVWGGSPRSSEEGQ